MSSERSINSASIQPPQFRPQIRPPIGHKMGYCTTSYTKQVSCPNCKRTVWELHQVELYSDVNVCAFCFEQVKERLKRK